MANVSISNENFSDFQDDQFHLNGHEEGELVVNGIEDPWFEHIDYADIDSFYSMFGPNNDEDTSDLQVRINLLEDQQQSISDWMQNHFPTNTVMPLQPVQIQPTGEIPGNDDLQTQVPERGNNSNEKPNPFSLASLELLKNYGRLSKNLSEENLSTNALNFEACLGNRHKLSMEEILRVAAERYIQYSTRKRDGLSRFIHPYGSALSGLCMEETRDVELVHHLIATVEEVNNQQFHLASKLISRCMWVASDSGTPVQRLSFYFAKALEERIHRSTGRYTCTDEDRHLKYIKTKSLGTNAASLTCHQLIPFNQVMQFAAVQTIVENVKSAKKIHLIDFNVRSGIQWIVLIQALAEKGDSPIELLKITAVGSTEKENYEVTGNTLHSFAKSLGLPFSFVIVFVSDMKDFKKESINIETDETVAVYLNFILRTMIPRPDCLDNLMKVVRSIRPTVIVVGEVEANHNSPSFLNRFIETLFFYSAFFDCFEDCMDRDSPCRTMIEEVYFGEGVRNIVAAEGEERFTRNVKLEVWRAFFERFGMMEEELSESSWYQADLILKQFAQSSSCDLHKDGKGLIIGWKGTPIHSLSIWKFL
ncbi:DELLA protein RGL1 [Capsicum chacoense]